MSVLLVFNLNFYAPPHLIFDLGDLGHTQVVLKAYF